MRRHLILFLLLLVAAPLSAATRLDVPGGWYVDACVNGDVTALIKDSHLQTPGGRVELPGGQNLLYISAACDGSGRFAGVGHRDDRAYEWTGIWSSPGMAFGVNSVIYDSAGKLRVAWATGPTGSQGWRYRADDGRLVTGDESYADPARHLWEYTIRGDIRCGQGGDEEGLQCLVRGRRVLVEPGVIRFIRFRREGDRLALAWIRQDTRAAAALWLSVAELEAYPTYTVPGTNPPPPPPPSPPPPPPPGQEPASLLEDVARARAKVAGQPTPAQLGAMLNAVAWKHRDKGWGLSTKTSGNKCPMPPPAATWIACDILHHKPTDQLYDVFVGQEDGARPTWSKAAHHNSASRPWLAPVAPIETEPDPVPVPEPDPELLARVTALEQRVAELLGFGDTITTLDQRIAALERTNGVPEEQTRALIDAALTNLRVAGTTSRDWGHGHQIDLQVIRR